MAEAPEATVSHADLPVVFLKPSEVPEPEARSQARLEAIRERGPQLRRLHSRAVAALTAGCLFLNLGAWGLGVSVDNFSYSNSKVEAYSSSSFPYFTVILFVITAALLLRERSGYFLKKECFSTNLAPLRGGSVLTG